jgi:hypothetical protein
VLCRGVAGWISQDDSGIGLGQRELIVELVVKGSVSDSCVLRRRQALVTWTQMTERSDVRVVVAQMLPYRASGVQDVTANDDALRGERVMVVVDQPA